MSKKDKLTIDDYRILVQNFFKKQMKFKEVQAQFDKIKKQFNSEMEDFFKCENIDKSVVFSSNNFAEEKLVVNRIQKSNVEFNVDKLEKKVDKKIAKQIIIKHYEIIDIDALIAYLKECNVDPRIFKSFLNVSKTIDVNELERLEELGKITAEQVKGCYTVKHQNPYFTVSMKKG